MIKIECPYCKKDNGVRLPENAECRHCKKSLNEHSFNAAVSKKSMLTAVSVSLLVGSGVGYIVENKLDDVRYRPEFEFAIISQCANIKEARYILESTLQKNIHRCSCALEKTIQKIGYKHSIDSELKEAFKNSLLECK